MCGVLLVILATGCDNGWDVFAFFTNESPGERMLRIPLNLGYFTVLHFDQKSAGIRAVLGAYRRFPHGKFSPDSFKTNSHPDGLVWPSSVFLYG